MDVFTDIRKQEETAVATVKNAIAAIDAEIQLANYSRALESAPGYQQYLQRLQALLARATDDLVTTVKGQEYLRWQQGRCQALRDVLTLLRGDDLLMEQLMQRRAALAENLQQLLRIAPKQRSEQDGQGQ